MPDDTKNLKNELLELSNSFAALNKNFTKIRADYETKEEKDEKMNEIMLEMYHMVDNVHNRIDKTNNYLFRIEEALWKHGNEGHLPKLTPSQLKKALKNCDADEDYKVEPKVIYANKQKNTLYF